MYGISDKLNIMRKNVKTKLKELETCGALPISSVLMRPKFHIGRSVYEYAVE